MQLEGSEQDITLCFDVGRDFKFNNLDCTSSNYYTIPIPTIIPSVKGVQQNT